jgi:hypothetical protein
MEDEIKLITLEELIIKKREDIICEMNKAAQMVFDKGEAIFTIYIRKNLWDIEEIRQYIIQKMEESNYHFIEIKTEEMDKNIYKHLRIAICETK